MKKIYQFLFIVSFLFSGKVNAQCTTPTNTPYFEGFSSIILNNQLPSCWAVSNPSNCLTLMNYAINTGNVASFYSAQSGDSHYYSNAIYLTAGITYTSSIWYKVLSSQSVIWTNLSISLSTSQNTTALVPIATTAANILNTNFSSLSNTFTAPSSGVYYLVVSASNNGTETGSKYLIWDELVIKVACNPIYNLPIVSVTAANTVFCSGGTFTASASGADSYFWTTGGTTSILAVTANVSSTYTVTGTSTLTGCSHSSTIHVLVNPSPQILAYGTNTGVICYGENSSISAIGGTTYSWSTGQTGTPIVVSPTATTTYSVVGTGTNGCTNTSAFTMTVQPLPTLTFTSSAATSTVCKGDLVTYTAGSQTGVSHYWTSTSTGSATGSVFNISPQITTTINLKGSEEGVCSNTVTFVINVDECTGLPKTNAPSTIKVFPNPGNGVYVLESDNSEIKNIAITDLNGKTIFYKENFSGQIQIDLKDYPNGIYFGKINLENEIKTIKIIKN